MSTKKENKKIITTRKRRNEYVLDNSDEGELSEDLQGSRRKIHYNTTLLKSSITPRKGRDLERTRSRPSTKITQVKSPLFSENTDGELEDDEEFDDSEILCDHSIVGRHDYCKERLKIGKNLLRNKYKGEVYKKEFREKVQTVFKEVYTYYYNSGNNKSTVNLEKDIKALSGQINEKLLNCRPDYLHLFVKLLHENVSIYIKSFKDSITEKCLIKKLKEKYYELKKVIYNDMNKDCNDTVIKQRCLKDVLNFCKENKKEIVSIINDLNKIYHILLKSSPLMNQIFKIPLMELENEHETNLTMENIHREEFFTIIINDDFIKSLIIEVKNKDLPIFIELRPIITLIEEEIASSNKDMKKLTDLIEQFSKENSKDLKEDDLSYLNDAKSLHQFLINTSKNNNRNTHCINVNCKNNRGFGCKEKLGKLVYDKFDEIDNVISNTAKLTSTSGDNLNISNHTVIPNENTLPNISKVKLKTNENVHKNLDELYEYIIADDNKQMKKQNKKQAVNKINSTGTKKKNCTISNVNDNSPTVAALEIDKEVEEFKTKLRIESVNAKSVRKVKPKFTVEWIQLLSNNII